MRSRAGDDDHTDTWFRRLAAGSMSGSGRSSPDEGSSPASGRPVHRDRNEDVAMSPSLALEAAVRSHTAPAGVKGKAGNYRPSDTPGAAWDAASHTSTPNRASRIARRA